MRAPPALTVPSHPQGPLHPSHTQGPYVSPRATSPCPGQASAGLANLQLPTALPYPAIALPNQACPWAHNQDSAHSLGSGTETILPAALLLARVVGWAPGAKPCSVGPSGSPYTAQPQGAPCCTLTIIITLY